MTDLEPDEIDALPTCWYCEGTGNDWAGAPPNTGPACRVCTGTGTAKQPKSFTADAD